VDEFLFRADLYEGAAEYYERYRPGYPIGLLDRLVQDAALSGHGGLLDLACGPGHVAFGLAPHFEEVWAVDQEADMVRVGRAKAERLGVSNIRWVNSPAEDLVAPPGSFALVTSGNAFHRLPRQRVAVKAYEWLAPGGCFALLWGGSPWRDKSAAWQKVFSETFELWTAELAAGDRAPAGLNEARAAKPDLDVLREVGFGTLGRFTEPVVLEWTFDSLVGFVYSTAVLPRAVLKDRAAEFERDLRKRPVEVAGEGPYVQETEFACELGRRPM
jgi:SAM-dependent methyltransferase